VTGLSGLLTLAVGVNSLAAALAACNLFVYCALYTPMKRLSTLNTSLGAVVGAIPPMIGWAAATATLDTGTNENICSVVFFFVTLDCQIPVFSF